MIDSELASDDRRRAVHHEMVPESPDRVGHGAAEFLRLLIHHKTEV